MTVVIQCAATKRSDCGHLRTGDGRPVLFVAHPDRAPNTGPFVYARPDDLAEDGRPWRDHLLEYNAGDGFNPYGLLPARQLYTHPIYARLADHCGPNRLYILSAGWGLIPGHFLTPAYDVTFSAGAAEYKRRRKRDPFEDFRILPGDSSEPVVFFGGKAYTQLFARLSAGVGRRRIVLYNSDTRPDAPGCETVRFRTSTRTNWHYGCARAFVEGRFLTLR